MNITTSLRGSGRPGELLSPPLSRAVSNKVPVVSLNTRRNHQPLVRQTNGASEILGWEDIEPLQTLAHFPLAKLRPCS